jgi:hypothetical protein
LNQKKIDPTSEEFPFNLPLTWGLRHFVCT